MSFSELGEFATVCQQRWFLNYVAGKRAELNSIHFDFGTSVHAALEAYSRRKRSISQEHALTLFSKKLSWLYKKNGPKYKEKLNAGEFAEFMAAGLTIIRAFEGCPELKDVEVVFNEFKLFEPIDRTDGLEIKFKGYIDYVIKATAKNGDVVFYICDFKTCAWGWTVEKKQDKWKHYQLLLYKYFFCKKFNLDPKYVRTAFILLKRKPPAKSSPIEFLPISAGPKSVQRALDVLNESITEMSERTKTGVFKKNTEQCLDRYGGRCPFYETPHCDGSPKGK